MKKVRFPLIMTLLALVSAIIVYVLLLISSPWLKPLPQALLYFIPALIFGIITGIGLSGKVSVKICNVITAVFIPIFLIGGFFLTLSIGILSATQTVTDVQYYAKAKDISGYDEWSDETDIDLLPDDLPKNAEDIKFYYTPQFLQGGETLAVSFKASADYIADYREEIVSDSIWSGSPAEASEYPIDTDPFPNSKISWSQSAEVIIFTAQPYLEGSWNHGTLVYMMIDHETQTIMFTYERW